jgi:ribosomal protein S14
MDWLQLVCLSCHGEYHPHHTFLTVPQQKARAAEKKADRAAKAKRDAKRCKHCGDTYPKAKHNAICVRFGLHR